jgi:hypothetical protein
VETACREIIRVARHEIIIGVPFQQDIRLGRTTCAACGNINPPWGHVNSFDERRLIQLFSGVKLVSKSFAGTTSGSTNAFATFLMDRAGNPWGTYNQEEPCLRCGAHLTPPPPMRLSQKVCAALAVRMNRLQSLLTRPHGNWIHLVFSKTAP